jgi:hypothetical protein
MQHIPILHLLHAENNAIDIAIARKDYECRVSLATGIRRVLFW